MSSKRSTTSTTSTSTINSRKHNSPRKSGSQSLYSSSVVSELSEVEVTREQHWECMHVTSSISSSWSSSKTSGMRPMSDATTSTFSSSVVSGTLQPRNGKVAHRFTQKMMLMRHSSQASSYVSRNPSSFSTACSDSSTHATRDDNSVIGESMSGMRSVATADTFSSVETIKASNIKGLPTVSEEDPPGNETYVKPSRQKAPVLPTIPSTAIVVPKTTFSSSSAGPLASPTKSKGPWRKFKRALRVKGSAEASGTPIDCATQSSKRDRRTADDTVGVPVVPRLSRFVERSRSDGKPTPVTAKAVSHARSQSMDYSLLDQSVRGRLDGVEVLSLGSATCQIFAKKSTAAKSTKPWEETQYTVAGYSTRYKPAAMVQDMLWTSGGRELPEMVLEGFSPGATDRWTVQVEDTSRKVFRKRSNNISPSINKNKASPKETFETRSPPPPALQHSDEYTTSEDSEISPSQQAFIPMASTTHKLWISLWGDDPVPSEPPAQDWSKGNDPLLNLAAESSIPVDLDVDTFIVSTRDHLHAVQDLASVPLGQARFETALRIFEKLLLGIQDNHRPNSQERYLKGATHHNMGLVHLWHGTSYSEAEKSFAEALKERQLSLPHHLDVVVTQCRQAQALFALERYREAIALLEGALALSQQDIVVRAKLLNNLGVIHFVSKDFARALKSFAQALELQRTWLAGPTIRRESMVYDASVSLNNLGILYMERSDFELASAVFEEAWLMQTTLFPKNHSVVLSSLSNLAWAKAMHGQTQTALRLLEGCWKSQVTAQGPSSPRALETLGLMAQIYARVERYKDALGLYQQIRQWQKKHLKNRPPHHLAPGGHGNGGRASTGPQSIRLVKECIKEIEKKAPPRKSSLSAWI